MTDIAEPVIPVADFVNRSEAYVRSEEHRTHGDTRNVRTRDRSHNTTIIGLFAHKGGVGKTSHTINLGATLARDYRVLLVDADPQCNLTSYFRRDGTEDDEEMPDNPDDAVPNAQAMIRAYPLHQASRENPIDLNIRENGRYIGEGVSNLYHLLLPAFNGRRAELRPPDRLLRVLNREEHVSDRQRLNLFLLPGSPMLATLEEAFSDNNRLLRVGNRGAFQKLMRDTAEIYQFDYILVDFAPSSSHMNKTMLLSCDYILPPLFPGIFSLLSMDVMLRFVLPNVIELKARYQAEQENATTEEKATGWVFREGLPRLLPFIISNFKVYSKQVGRIVCTSPGKYIAAMENLVRLPAISQNVRDLYVQDGGSMVIPFVQCLNSLQTSLQERGIPVVLQRPQGRNNDTTIIRHTTEAYNSLAQFIVNLTHE